MLDWWQGETEIGERSGPLRATGGKGYLAVRKPLFEKAVEAISELEMISKFGDGSGSAEAAQANLGKAVRKIGEDKSALKSIKAEVEKENPWLQHVACRANYTLILVAERGMERVEPEVEEVEEVESVEEPARNEAKEVFDAVDFTTFNNFINGIKHERVPMEHREVAKMVIANYSGSEIPPSWVEDSETLRNLRMLGYMGTEESDVSETLLQRLVNVTNEQWLYEKMKFELMTSLDPTPGDLNDILTIIQKL